MTATDSQPSPPSLFHDLTTLVQSMQPAVIIDTPEEERVDELLRAVAAGQRLPLFTWTVTRGLQRIDGGPAIYGTTEPKAMLRHLSSLTVRAIFHLKDLAPYLGDATVARAFREAAQAFRTTGSTIVLSGDQIALPGELAREAVPLHMPLPGHDELRTVVKATLQALRAGHAFDIALDSDGMARLLDALSGLTVNQARQALAWAVLNDARLDAADLPALLKRKADALGEDGLLEFIPPGGDGVDLGGFDRLKHWLADAQAGFTPEARQLGLAPPRGVLIVGVQGCGKSLAAKAIARLWAQPLLKLDAARLYDKFVGESEKHLRRALDVAEALAPSVLWIDEIEKGFASGGDADSGLSRRMLGSFLTWLQEHASAVFVAATANDVSSVPPELLRKGRFDEVFFVDLPDAQERDAILRIHLLARRQDPAAFDLAALTAATDGFSGAEIEQLVVAALYRALHDKQPLTTAGLLEGARQTSPLSVSRREEIDRLRATAGTRFVPVR